MEDPKPSPLAEPIATVIVVDDQAIVRAGLATLLEGTRWIRVIGEAANGRELLTMLQTVRPDAVLTDLGMPDVDGFAVARLVRDLYPGVPVIAVSMHDSAPSVRRAFQHGATAFVSKAAPLSELEDALRKALAGVEGAPPVASDDTSDGEALSPRQLEVLALMAQSRSSKEIASTLGISLSTVEVHRSNIWRRLGFRDMASLTLYAVRHGLVSPEL